MAKTKHTPGRLHHCDAIGVAARPDIVIYPIRARNGSLVAAVLTMRDWRKCVDQAIPSMAKAKANARHIVDCWNAASAD